MRKRILSFYFLFKVFFLVAIFGSAAAYASTVSVTITGPTTTTIVIGTTFTITATATSSGSTMNNVKFISNTGSTINTDNSSPYTSSVITAPTTPGTYTYQVKGTDNLNATKTVNLVITTVAPTAPTISGGGTGCGAGSVTLTASGGNPSGGTYNWYNVSSGGTALATGTTYAPVTGGSYYASYTYNTYEGTRSGATTVTINSEPVLSTAPTTPTSGLYLSYPFTGNANDVSGNSNNGTAQASAPLATDRYGAANSAYSFDGSTQYISTTTASASPGPQNFSISVWFKTSSAGGMLVGYGSSQTGSSGLYDRHIYMSNTGQLYFGLYPNTVKTINTTTTYADGNWHHVVATESTTTGADLYVDGAVQVIDTTMTASQTFGANGYWRVAYDNLSGWINPPTNYYFTGSLDDIAVYNTALTAAQVYALYGAGSPPTCVGSPLLLQANTISGATYAWSGPGFTSTQQNPTVSASATSANAGTYTLTVTGANGCTTTTTVTAVVNALPVSTFTVTSPVNVGSSSTITYTGTYSASSSYVWDFNGGTIVSGSGVGPYTIQWSTAGSKTVTLTVTNPSTCSSVSTQTVIVGAPAYGNYGFGDPITLKTSTLGITSNLTNFPALLSIQDNNLMISGTCTDKVYNPNGPNYDFAFTLPGSSTELYYQVESYNQTTGTLLVWVQIPSLTYATNNTIDFYYGSKSPTVTHNTAFFNNTWGSDYKAVYHFNESAYTGSVTDGTSNGHTGTDNGMTSGNVVTGKIGNAYSFNGSSQSISNAAVNITGAFTISAWVNMTVGSRDQKIMTNQATGGSSTGGYKLGIYSNNIPESESGSAVNRGSTPVASAVATGAWHYLQSVYTGSTLSTYVDGSAYQNLSTTVSPTSTTPFYIGVGEGGSSYYFDGIIDEVRVSNVAKTSDWLKAEYVDQNSPASFTSVSGTTVNSTNAAAISGALTYTWTGGTSTDPTNANNWTNTTSGTANQLPAFDGTASLVIPAGLSKYPSLTANESLYGLTIASGASFSLNGFTLSVGCNIYNSSGGQILYGNNYTSGITWNGSQANQTYTGTGTSNTASLGSMTINNSAGGTVTISSGPVDIYNTLTLINGKLVVGASPAALTLKSTAAQSASVAAIPSGSSITGNVTVERFVTGGSTYTAGRWIYRNYRLMSSPVNEGVDGSGNYPYSINYIAANTIVTDCTSSYGTTAGNPSLYLFNEGYTPNNSTFISGNFIGITNISSTAASGHITTTDASNSSAKLYVGDGYMMYFRGNKTSNITGSPSKTSYPYVAPDNVTFSTTGTLNQGTYSVVSWTGYTGLLYTTSNSGNVKVRGYNLVGNPYASSIDWSLFSSTNSAAPIYGPNVNPTVYIFNPTTSNYDTYTAGTGAVTGSATKVIPSGQGFFVQSNNHSSSLTFTESAKTSAQVTGSNLLLGTPVTQNAYNSFMRLKLVTDSINYNDIVIGFNSTSTTNFNANEDAAYLAGSAAPESLSSMSNDKVKTAVKWLPLPKNSSNLVNKLNVGVTASGLYTLVRADLKGIPQIYQIWLMDNYKKDSLDIRNNTTYAFNVNLADTASFGNNRFQVVVREDPALGVHLLNFTAAKATNGAQIVWKTENEENYTNFTVQRSSDNGATFNVIGGFSSNNLGTYSLTDATPPVAADQYRLKLEDLNGTITYSKVVTLMYANSNNTIGLAKNNISVYPNPSKSTLNLTITGSGSTTATLAQASTTIATNNLASNTVYGIKIVNSSGNVVKNTTSAQPNWQTDVSGLVPGTYIIQVVNNANKSVIGKSTFIKL